MIDVCSHGYIVTASDSVRYDHEARASSVVFAHKNNSRIMV